MQTEKLKTWWSGLEEKEQLRYYILIGLFWMGVLLTLMGLVVGRAAVLLGLTTVIGVTGYVLYPWVRDHRGALLQRADAIQPWWQKKHERQRQPYYALGFVLGVAFITWFFAGFVGGTAFGRAGIIALGLFVYAMALWLPDHLEDINPMLRLPLKWWRAIRPYDRRRLVVLGLLLVAGLVVYLVTANMDDNPDQTELLDMVGLIALWLPVSFALSLAVVKARRLPRVLRYLRYIGHLRKIGPWLRHMDPLRRVRTNIVGGLCLLAGLSLFVSAGLSAILVAGALAYSIQPRLEDDYQRAYRHYRHLRRWWLDQPVETRVRYEIGMASVLTLTIIISLIMLLGGGLLGGTLVNMILIAVQSAVLYDLLVKLADYQERVAADRKARAERRAKAMEEIGNKDNKVARKAAEVLRLDGSLRDGSLAEAAMNGADLSRTRLLYMDLRGAKLVRANLGHAYLGFINLEGARLRGCNFGYSYMWRANLRGADLNSANLSHTTLWHADLRGADLSGASMEGANVWGTQFDTTTVLPDETPWHEDAEVQRFTRREHPRFWEPTWQQELTMERPIEDWSLDLDEDEDALQPDMEAMDAALDSSTEAFTLDSLDDLDLDDVDSMLDDILKE